MGKIDIPIYNWKINIGSLRLDNVLTVPDLDRRLFSVNFFLASGNKWVHFENNYIHLWSTNVLHDRFHRSDGVLATIKAHDLWDDVHITPGKDYICTSCKIMTIPTSSREKSRTTIPAFPLEEVQVNTVPNPEPQGLSIETRYNYFLILCDWFSRTFRLKGYPG